MQNEYNPYQSPKTKLAEAKAEYKLSENNYASRGERLLGAIVDGIAVGILTAIIFFGILDQDFFKSFADFGTISIVIITIIVSVFLYLTVHGYFMYKNAQTLGKYLLGMQVVDLNGKPISGNHYLFKRFLPIFALENIPLAGGLIGLINALMIFRKEHNCFHDDIARTRVISLKSYNEELPPINQEVNSLKEDNIKLEPASEFLDYTYSDLVSALDAIQEEQYPERAERLRTEIKYRKQIGRFD